jgi:hypothetical protein
MVVGKFKRNPSLLVDSQAGDIMEQMLCYHLYQSKNRKSRLSPDTIMRCDISVATGHHSVPSSVACMLGMMMLVGL